jgi:amino acid transporter
VSVWRWLVGAPLKASEAEQEEISEPEGLAALSLDALTSVAYGPQAMVLVLATAGVAGLRMLLPVTVSIVVLLVLLVLSYSQVIDAYPQGGGAYAVSRRNLGDGLSQLAAAALICDYVLTVAVSIAAGVAALTSAFPELAPLTVPLALAMLAVITVLNLRGVGEGARAFLLPTFAFIVGILVVIAAGLTRASPVAGATAPGPSSLGGVEQALGLLLLLKAFAAGCSALTGVEAIANGVPLFRQPRQARARRTEAALGILLAVMLLGLAIVATRFHIAPKAGETVLSQVMAASIGRGWLYYTVALATTATLGLAANTSFGGLPVLTSVLAADDYLPHLFSVRGDRLTFQYGIASLAVLSAVLLLAVRGNTDALIPLFAIGVFTGFTLAQVGLVVHWRRERPRGWLGRAVLNGFGAAATAIATAVFLLTKLTEGAWVVVLAIPLLIVLFRGVHRYYGRVAHLIAVGVTPPPPQAVGGRSLVVVPVRGLSALTGRAIGEARALGDEVLAVSVHFDAASAHALEEAWEAWSPGVRLVALTTQYRSIVRPLLRFVGTLDRQSHERVVVLIPEIVPRDFWHQLLHNQIGLMLASALRRRSDILVAIMPYHLPWEPKPEPAVARRTRHADKEGHVRS